MSYQQAFQDVITAMNGAPAQQTKEFEPFLRSNLEKYILPILQPVTTRKGKGLNGYNLFIRELRQKIGEMAFKEMGGLTGAATEWNKLTDDEKKQYNNRAKNMRETTDNVAVTPPTIVKKKKNLWQQYQQVWGNYRKTKNLYIPDNIAERSKASALDYKTFKQMSPEEQQEFLTTYASLPK